MFVSMTPHTPPAFISSGVLLFALGIPFTSQIFVECLHGLARRQDYVLLHTVIETYVVACTRQKFISLMSRSTRWPCRTSMEALWCHQGLRSLSFCSSLLACGFFLKATSWSRTAARALHRMEEGGRAGWGWGAEKGPSQMNQSFETTFQEIPNNASACISFARTYSYGHMWL